MTPETLAATAPAPRPMTADTANFTWLLSNFCRSVPLVHQTLVVSADGLLMAMSDGLDRTAGDQMAAIVSGLSSLVTGAARRLRAGGVRQVVVEMDRLFLFVCVIGDGSSLAVVADADCDVGLVGYEMTLLVNRTEAAMTPQLVTEMRAMLRTDGPRRGDPGGGG